MKENLSIREAKFLDAYLECGVISRAAQMAGYRGRDTNSLHKMGSRVLQRVGVTLQDIQNRLGITDASLSQKLQDGLQAEKKFWGTWQGEIIASAPFPDHQNRLKALEIAHRLRGQFLDRQELSGRDGGDIILRINPARKKGSPLNLDLDEE